MKAERPGSVTAAAVMAMVYGSLFTICGLCGIAGLAMQGAAGFGDPNQAKMQKHIEEVMEREVPAYRVTQVVIAICGLLLALAILSAGIGLLGMGSWARILALLAGLCAIAFTGLQAVYQLVFIMPATSQALQVAAADMPKGPGAPDMGGFMQALGPIAVAGTVAFELAVIVYLAIMVLLLVRPSVRAAFAGGGMTPKADAATDDYADEGWGKSSRPPAKPNDEFGIERRD